MAILLFLLNAGCYAGQSATGKQYAAKGGPALHFNITKVVAAVFLFAVWLFLQGEGLHLPTLPYAAAYGIVLAVSLYTGFKALSCGPMALTSVLVSMSLLIPFIWGFAFWKESVTVPAILGLICIITAIIFIQFKSQSGFSSKWIVYTTVTMLANGFASVIQKYHQSAYPGLYQVDFMLAAMAVAAIPTVFSITFQKCKRIQISLLGISSGLLNGLANFIILLLSADQDATILFPLISTGNVMAAWLTGIIFFQEHIQLRQMIGLLFGIMGIVLLTYK